MAAEIFLYPLLEVVFEKVGSHILKKIAVHCGLEKDIDKLQHTLEIIQAVLEDAEGRQAKEKPLKIWLSKLKDVAYDADDLLDEYLCIQDAESRGRFTSLAKHFKGMLRYRSLVPKLRNIRVMLEDLAVERFNFNLKEVLDGTGRDVEWRRQTGSCVTESEVFGREEDKEAMVELLLVDEGREIHQNVSVVPIVGIGGLGKTTLAQLAYNDERMTKNFKLKIWVCVNEEFNVRKIMQLIIESVTMNRCDFQGMDVLQSRLRQLLRGQRYLLVLDDVWNEDHDEWDKLRASLSDGAKGSKVIVTTRSMKVALIVGTFSPYHVKGLSHDDCWALFKQRAFARGEDHPKLLPIGKEIVKKCGGIPLAAKALGSLMRFKREEGEWLDVQESDLWNAYDAENGILPALRLSYDHLPSHLKCCFTYCAVFPKNYVIKKEDLIHLWIAESLIHSNEERKSLEDIGNDCFNDLMWMFFFQDVNTDSDGSITECKMHDLIHDLAQSIAGNEFVILEHGRVPRQLDQIRHSSVVCDSELQAIPELLYEARKLRTLNLLFPKVIFWRPLPTCFQVSNICGP